MTSTDDIIEQRRKPRKSLSEKLDLSRNLFMGLAFLVMAVIMIFPDKIGADFVLYYNELQRYLFGGICSLYGFFRLYRVYIDSKN